MNSNKNHQASKSTVKASKANLPFRLESLIVFAIILTFTGFIQAFKVSTDEDCTCKASNVLCYECDSRFDPNCADPFDFSPWTTIDQQQQQQLPVVVQQTPKSIADETKRNNNSNGTTNSSAANTTSPTQYNQRIFNGDSITTTTTPPKTPPSSLTTSTQPAINSNETIPQRQPKKLPAVAICHGCCVKIASQTDDGGVYVRRTCTSNIQINMFMVALICMNESGNRGKMCFCETDYCNAASSINSFPTKVNLLLILFIVCQLIAHLYHLHS